MFVSRKVLSNDKMSTGLDDRLHTSYNVIAFYLKRSRIQSINIKLIIGPCGIFLIIDPSVEKFGLTVSG